MFDRVYEVITSAADPIHAIQRLIVDIHSVTSGDKTVDEVAAEQEGSEAKRWWTTWIPSTPQKAQDVLKVFNGLAEFLKNMVLPVLLLLGVMYPKTVPELVSRIIETQVKPKPNHARESVRTVNPKAKVGRNAPCPCGSKVKYKKCCWQPR